ncbi:MAG: hypothetical protein HC825_07140 [Oscillatoriales cyanobacterium RM1_1_9]|nr:hypothetical protein [Oscillatoriales cyanobacterium RM1_1_9]
MPLEPSASGQAQRHEGFNLLVTNPTFADLSDSKVESFSLPVDGEFNGIDLSESQTVHIVTTPMLGQANPETEGSDSATPEAETPQAENPVQEDNPDSTFQNLQVEEKIRVLIERSLRAANHSLNELFSKLNVALETDCLQMK